MQWKLERDLHIHTGSHPILSWHTSLAFHHHSCRCFSSSLICCLVECKQEPNAFIKGRRDEWIATLFVYSPDMTRGDFPSTFFADHVFRPESAFSHLCQSYSSSYSIIQTCITLASFFSALITTDIENWLIKRTEARICLQMGTSLRRLNAFCNYACCCSAPPRRMDTLCLRARFVPLELNKV